MILHNLFSKFNGYLKRSLIPIRISRKEMTSGVITGPIHGTGIRK